MYQEVKLQKKQLFWYWLIYWAVTFSALEAPYSFTFKTRIQNWQLWSDGVISFLFVLDLVFRYFEKQQEKKSKQKEVILIHHEEEESIWTNKFFNAFMFTMDIISCIPFDIISFWLINHYAGFHPEMMTFCSAIRLGRLARVTKLFHVLKKMTMVPSGVKIQVYITSSVIAINWIACGWILIHPLPMGVEQPSYFLKALYWVVTTLTTIGYGDITPTTDVGRIYTMAIMILGVGVYGMVIGNMARMLSLDDRHKEQAMEKMHDLRSFMKYYKIPDKLQQTCYSYFNHLNTKRLSENDTQIIADFPAALQHELKTHMNIKLIRGVPLFKAMSRACLKEIATYLVEESFSPGKNIINIGEHGEEMYIIAHGSVDIIIQDGTSVASLHEGQIFGEAALIQDTTRNANVRAAAYCDVYKLTKESFDLIIKKHPELKKSMQSMTKRRSSDRRGKRSAS